MVSLQIMPGQEAQGLPGDGATTTIRHFGYRRGLPAPTFAELNFHKVAQYIPSRHWRSRVKFLATENAARLTSSV